MYIYSTLILLLLHLSRIGTSPSLTIEHVALYACLMHAIQLSTRYFADRMSADRGSLGSLVTKLELRTTASIGIRRPICIYCCDDVRSDSSGHRPGGSRSWMHLTDYMAVPL